MGGGGGGGGREGFEISLVPMLERSIAKHTLNSVFKISKTGTLFTVFPTKTIPFHDFLSLHFTPNRTVFFLCVFFIIRFEKTYPFPRKMPFSDPKRWQRCALPSLKKKHPFSSLFFFFFFGSSLGTKSTSKCRFPPPRGTNVSPSMTYAHRIPPACRVMPTFVLLRVSVPFYQVVRICRQTAQSYVCSVIIHVHFLCF